ncbi:type II secretion system F family protein [Anaerosolibacter sp.]|uniref:type II secretion system F family protein n=1 Tax=Anaerosolibacter sp. TaxID=1872527 RepID=UPI0039EE73E2
MYRILIPFALLFSLGSYFIVADLLKLPTNRSTKVIIVVDRREKKKTRNFEVIINQIAIKASKWIKLTDYQRRKLQATLKSADFKLSPETYIAKAWIKAGLAMMCIVPALFIFPILVPVILFLSVAIYFKEIQRAEAAVKKRKDDIEFELPRFVSTLTQELKASRNVLNILETYKHNAGDSFKRELEITVADMRSGSYESAVTRFETRIGSPKLSDVIRGLIGVLRGDDGVVYFQMLSHDLKQLELQRLKTIAMKRPGKIRKYSFAMLFCFLLMYLSVMFVEIVKALGDMF